MALNSLLCADVPLRNCSINQFSLTLDLITHCLCFLCGVSVSLCKVKLNMYSVTVVLSLLLVMWETKNVILSSVSFYFTISTPFITHHERHRLIQIFLRTHALTYKYSCTKFFRLHHLHTMHRCDLSLKIGTQCGLYVCVFVSLCKNGRSSQNLLRCHFGVDSYGPKEPCIRWDPDPHIGRGNFEGHVGMDQNDNVGEKMVIPEYVEHARMLSYGSCRQSQPTGCLLAVS